MVEVREPRVQAWILGKLLPMLLFVCAAACAAAAFGTSVCVCLVLHTQPCYRPDLQAGRAAAASLGLGWRNHLGLFLAGHITWGGGFLGLLDLVAP